MRKKIILALEILTLTWSATWAQPGESMYGDVVKADIKMKYTYVFEDALKKAAEENKLIFFNCFADWALPCHAMNKQVFSDQEFADWMDKHFVNLFIDITTPEGEAFEDKYNITFQAHYLILDKHGDIVHRIVGGREIPIFKKKLMMALNPKTSLRELDKQYVAGNRKTKFLRDYALVLQTADQREKYDSVLNQYFSQIHTGDWVKKENWLLFQDKVKKPEGEMYDYLVTNKNRFAKHIEEEEINDYIRQLYFPEIFFMATGKEKGDGTRLLDIYTQLRRANLPDSNTLYILYDVAKHRTAGDFDKLMGTLEKEISKLDEQTTLTLDLSLKNLSALSVQEKNKVANYLTERAKGMPDDIKRAYQAAIKDIVNPEGIRFSSLSFDEALQKAGTEGKLLFIDCYTSWCSPCKTMEKDVFSRKTTGDYFNQHFVNLKVDMEKGEGPDVLQKYNIEGFPTMLFLNHKGQEVYRILGATSHSDFMEKVKKHVPLQLPEADKED